MKSNATLSVKAKETTREVTIEIPNEERDNVAVGILKNNHLKGLFSDYSIINQEFFNYVISCNLTGRQSKILFFILANVDLENRALLNNEVISKALKIATTNVSKEVNFLVAKKIILKKKTRHHSYQLSINYDMVNPNFLFKNKATKENVKQHKLLMEQETPYVKQQNIFGEIDMVNPDTGEVFYTIPQEKAHKHMIGTKRACKNLPSHNTTTIEIEAEQIELDEDTAENEEVSTSSEEKRIAKLERDIEILSNIDTDYLEEEQVERIRKSIAIYSYELFQLKNKI